MLSNQEMHNAIDKFDYEHGIDGVDFNEIVPDLEIMWVMSNHLMMKNLMEVMIDKMIKMMMITMISSLAVNT